jgi:hypothetical protein
MVQSLKVYLTLNSTPTPTNNLHIYVDAFTAKTYSILMQTSLFRLRLYFLALILNTRNTGQNTLVNTYYIWKLTLDNVLNPRIHSLRFVKALSLI